MTDYRKSAPETIQEMFGSIAKSYDRTNALLSFQLHRYWNRFLVRETSLKNHGILADLCCGTGEIAFTWLKSAPKAQAAYLIDFCPEMLECAKLKAEKLQLELKHKLSYLQADVQNLPLDSDSIDFATMAYGIRNVKDPALCFKEVFRTLKKGGKFGILELTEPENAFLRFGHGIYLKAILPVLGKFLSSNRQAYEYLSNSIKEFIKPQALKVLLQQAGFSEVHSTPLTGGIATVITAKKLTLMEFQVD